MPFLKDGADNSFWEAYREIYNGSLVEAEKGNLQFFDEVFIKRTAADHGQLFSCNQQGSIIYYAVSWLSLIATSISVTQFTT